MYNGTLNLKRTTRDANGNEVLDICAPTIDLKKLRMLSDGLYLVREEFAMRPDRIAYEQYSDVEKIDAIMWMNNIYNPFAIDELDMLYVPYAKNTDSFYRVPEQVQTPSANTTAEKISSASTALNKAASETMAQRTTSAKSQNAGKAKRIPVNVLGSNQTSKTVSGPNIILGSNIRHE